MLRYTEHSLSKSVLAGYMPGKSGGVRASFLFPLRSRGELGS